MFCSVFIYREQVRGKSRPVSVRSEPLRSSSAPAQGLCLIAFHIHFVCNTSRNSLHIQHEQTVTIY